MIPEHNEFSCLRTGNLHLLVQFGLEVKLLQRCAERIAEHNEHKGLEQLEEDILEELKDDSCHRILAYVIRCACHDDFLEQPLL